MLQRASYRTTLFLLGAFGLAARAAEPEKVTTVEGITEYRLGNGLKVLLFPDPSKDTVTVNITYFVGSRHEGYGETGMAHLLEHMVFKGTPTHPQIWKSLQDHGAQFNGTTWLDRTNYYETLAAGDENLEFALAMEADRMVNSHIAKKDLDSEMTVVRNEFEMGENSPVGVLSERMASTAYLWHNYGQSTIGSREDLERVPIDRLQAFYKKYYQPDNAMLVVAGKFDDAKTLQQINALFGAIPRPERKIDITYTVEPTQDGEREVTLRRVGDVQAVGAIYHICPGAHEDMVAVEALASVLTADQTGRLYKALVEPRMATSVQANASVLFDPGMMEIMAEVRTDQSIDDVRTKMFEVLDKLGTDEISKEEVDRAKNRFARDFDLLVRNSGRVGVELTEWAAAGDWRLMFLHRDRMAKVTPADVKRVAAEYLKPDNRTVGVFMPTKAPDRSIIPPQPDLVALLKDYKGGESVSAGAEFAANYKNIESHTKRSELPTGIKVAYLPKETRGDRVNVNITLRYGSEGDFKGKVDAAGFLGAMLMSGTAKMTKRQIQDKIDELKSSVNIGGGGRGGSMGGGGAPGAMAVFIETTRENLPAVLALVTEILREPSFPADEFDKMQKRQLAGLEEQLSEPMVLASIQLGRRLNPYPPEDVRYVPTPEESIARIKAVKLEDVKAIYTGLLGASVGEAAVVGDFDPAEVTPALATMFKNWPSPRSFERIEMPYRAVPPDTVAINTPDKANALCTVGMNVEIRDDDPDYPALFVANYMLGSNANSRLMNRIRQTEGLSYGASSFLQVSSQDKSGTFGCGGICAPENAERLLVCVKEELERLLKDGVTQQELDDARSGYRQQIEVSLANDAAVARMLARGLYLGRTLQFQEEQLAKIEALKPDDVKAALIKYVKPDQLVVVRAGDFEKKTAPGPEPKQPGVEKPEVK